MTPAPDEKVPTENSEYQRQMKGFFDAAMVTQKRMIEESPSPKPCPACGGEACRVNTVYRHDRRGYMGQCPHCGASGSFSIDRGNALAAWDAMPRRSDHPLGAVRLLLRAALRTMGERLDDAPASRAVGGLQGHQLDCSWRDGVGETCDCGWDKTAR